MNTLFQSLDNLMTEGMALAITVQKSGDNLICSILPKHTEVKDEAAKKIVPLTVSGTPVELDKDFVEAISSPVKQAVGVLSNMAEFEASTITAEKKSKKAEADKKKFDQLIKKADQLEKDKKTLNAVACLKQALDFATNKKQIEDRIKKLEASAAQNTIFGDMDTEDPVQENYLDGEEEEPADDEGDNEEGE